MPKQTSTIIFIFISEAWDLLLNKGGWVDSEMSIGVKGMLEIISRRFKGTDTVPAWKFDQEGNIENDIQHRGVEKLPNYLFRDDALELRRIIKEYVKKKVYDTYKGKWMNLIARCSKVICIQFMI